VSRILRVCSAIFFYCVTTNAFALDAKAMAPLNEKEFFSFFDEYRSFSNCIDSLAQKEGLDSNKVAQKLVDSGEAETLVNEARSVLAKDSQFLQSINSAQFSSVQKIQLSMLALATQAKNHDITQTQHLVAMGLARIFVARASSGECGPNKNFMDLFDKARK